MYIENKINDKVISYLHMNYYNLMIQKKNYNLIQEIIIIPRTKRYKMVINQMQSKVGLRRYQRYLEDHIHGILLWCSISDNNQCMII